jgi:Xaa-Pro aminopeptidase
MSLANRHEERREALRQRLSGSSLSGLLVSHAANRFYLSGFERADPQCNESAGLLLVTAAGGDWLLTDARFGDAAARVFPAERVLVYGQPKLDEIRRFLKDKCPSDLGFEAAGMSFALHARLSGEIGLVPTGKLVEDLRMIKDEDEIARMRRSAALNHAVFAQVPELLVPGLSERELAWELEKRFRERGAEELAFAIIAAVGRNAALPHAVPGDDHIREGLPVLVDMGCRLDAYCSDQTRTYWVGKGPSDRFMRTLDLVREAQEAAIARIRPGLPISGAYLAAAEVFDKVGMAERFTHGLGHGVGLETHEPPSISTRSEGEFRPGMIVTAEPGLYDPAWGGVRWEHMVLVTEDGCEVL